jgi:hypothetical protein
VTFSSPQDRRERLALRLSELLEKDFAHSFAGITIEPTGVYVHAVPDEGLRRAVDAAARDFARRDELRVVPVLHSLVELERLQARLGATL